jgi:hypothetical protein
MIGGNINFNYGSWIGNNIYSNLEAQALNMLNIATTSKSTETYNNNEIWYDIKDKSKQTYTFTHLIENIVGKADIMECMKIKNVAIVLLSAVNERFRHDAIHESRRGTLESGHNNYAINLSKFYSTLDSALSRRVEILITAKKLENKSNVTNLRKRNRGSGNKKKQRTRTNPKPKKQRTRTKPKPKKQRTRTKPKK